MQDAKCVSTLVDELVKSVESDVKCLKIGSWKFVVLAYGYKIAFAVSNVAKFSSNPTKLHWTAVKRILRYLKGIRNFRLLYTNGNVDEFIGYSDPDWAGDLDD